MLQGVRDALRSFRCFVAAGRTKTPLFTAREPLGARNGCSGVPSRPLGAPNGCSGVPWRPLDGRNGFSTIPLRLWACRTGHWAFERALEAAEHSRWLLQNAFETPGRSTGCSSTSSRPLRPLSVQTGYEVTVQNC